MGSFLLSFAARRFMPDILASGAAQGHVAPATKYGGVTYVATEGPDLLGIATVSPGQIEGSDLPSRLLARTGIA